jgi:hypothetical protein
VWHVGVAASFYDKSRDTGDARMMFALEPFGELAINLITDAIHR